MQVAHKEISNKDYEKRKLPKALRRQKILQNILLQFSVIHFAIYFIFSHLQRVPYEYNYLSLESEVPFLPHFPYHSNLMTPAHLAES